MQPVPSVFRCPGMRGLRRWSGFWKRGGGCAKGLLRANAEGAPHIIGAHFPSSGTDFVTALATALANPLLCVYLRRTGRQNRAPRAVPSAQSRWDVFPSFSIDARRRPRPLPPMPPPPRLPPRFPSSSPSSSAGAAGAGGVPTTALWLLPDGGAHDGACNGACNGGEAAAAGVGALTADAVEVAATGGGRAGPSPAPLFLPPLRFPFRPCRREKKEAGRGA